MDGASLSNLGEWSGKASRKKQPHVAGQSSAKRCPEGIDLKNYISEVKVRADGVELPRLDSKGTGSVDTGWAQAGRGSRGESEL